MAKSRVVVVKEESAVGPDLRTINKEKQVINICDALFGVVSGGPGGYPQEVPKSMIFSRDPVAHDRVIWLSLFQI